MKKPERLESDLENEPSLKEEMLKWLERLLNEWSDEVPEEILHGEGKFKVRVNWWNAVTGWMNVIMGKNLIEDDELIERMKKFVKTYAGRDYWQRGHKRTTKEDIDTANHLLTDMIGYLKEKKE